MILLTINNKFKLTSLEASINLHKNISTYGSENSHKISRIAEVKVSAKSDSGKCWNKYQ